MTITVEDMQRVDAQMEAAAGAGELFASKGKKNAYVCESCNRRMHTIDRHAGVTPFIKRCEICGGEAKSAFYRLAYDPEPEFEWYRPLTEEEIAAVRDEILLSARGTVEKWTRRGTPLPEGLTFEETVEVAAKEPWDHLKRGGLAFRRIEKTSGFRPLRFA